MDEKEIRRRIEEGREWIRSFNREYEGYETDQQLKKPQPPLCKAAMREESVLLPRDFENLEIDNDFLHVINSRCSHRVYTEETMSLRQLSYLLWCSQGVKEIRGKAYATLRTVPCGGARHEFECYMAVQNVEDLTDGLYHYLPMKHAVEKLSDCEEMRSFISDSLCGQSWAAKANVVFYYSAVFYRAEWRYGIHAYVPMMMDAGHITENVYLAATSIHLGGCAIAAVEGRIADEKFGLDGKEESVFYAMPIGTISSSDHQKEQDFYAFVKEQGL
ncbi:MAG: SagB/ThcOx family dehydrogenase [Erysipelotrichaceae bacterium]|nr:SagB/ThcOx family dehydrogenase [Erysipelotrichaceae bacterium]